MTDKITAQIAFEHYEDALHNGWLRQGTWNSEEDGRRVACALGVIDKDVGSSNDCPATVMQELHRRAMKGDRADRKTWYSALRNANADAYVYANADAYVNANANANANADANADAYVYANANADARKKAIARLANGLIECMERVSPETAS